MLLKYKYKYIKYEEIFCNERCEVLFFAIYLIVVI